MRQGGGVKKLPKILDSFYQPASSKILKNKNKINVI
jgi:hypothetical protein